MLIVIGDSILSAMLIVTLLHFVYGNDIFSLLAANIFFNQFITMIVMGIPYLIVCSVRIQKKKQKLASKNEKQVLTLSINERFILGHL